MNTQIDYLKQLETDLKDVAVREMARASRSATATPARRRAGQVWLKLAGVAAAFLVVAGAIGFLASGGDISQMSPGGGAAEGPQRAVGRSTAPEQVAAPQPGSVPQISRAHKEALDSSFAPGESSEARPQQLADLSKIIRDGRIGVTVPDGDFEKAVGDLTFIADKHGGFILSSSTQGERSGTFVLRIPARNFDKARADVRNMGIRVDYEQVRGQDVTAEYIDYQARLRILQARKAVLLRLFDQADTIPETLQLQSQLDDVQLRIEQIQGQLHFIDDQVAESTLRVSIQEKNAPHAEPLRNVENPNLGSAWDLSVQGFLRIVGAVIVGLGYLIPLTILAAIVWLGVWFARRRRAA